MSGMYKKIYRAIGAFYHPNSEFQSWPFSHFSPLENVEAVSRLLLTYDLGSRTKLRETEDMPKATCCEWWRYCTPIAIHLNDSIPATLHSKTAIHLLHDTTPRLSAAYTASTTTQPQPLPHSFLRNHYPTTATQLLYDNSTTPADPQLLCKSNQLFDSPMKFMKIYFIHERVNFLILQWCGRNRVVGRPDPEEEEEEEEIEEITQTDIQYIQENLNADSGPARASTARRPGRPRTNASVAPSVNVEENEAADGQEQVPARRRGRPRTNASVASSVNVEQNEAAGEQQQVPVRRRGRPRTNAPAASSVNQEQNEAAGEQAPVPTRRRGRPRTNASAASSGSVDQNEPTGEQLPVPARRRGGRPRVNLIDALEASTDEENDDDSRITSTDHNSTNENIGAMDNIESININDILTTEESAFNASTTQAPAMLDQEMNEVENERIGNLDLQNQNDVIFDEQEANTSPIAPALVLVNANAIITREAKKDDDSGIPRKKRRRNPRKKCQLLSCETKFRVRKLDCGHRYCVPCIRNFISRFCPQCRRPIGNYLPPEHMGGERWELGEDQQLEREFAHQTTRERIDLINSTRNAYHETTDSDSLRGPACGRSRFPHSAARTWPVLHTAEIM
ncbi:unnamed protein product [Trichogramma brassicae]|uniref:RING-type domain-containing protein n=2 Tax=Trichogramma brassicae TaxID=86971 RepID=A0A6H5I1I0_9HYME|nr:unnamed protein product [Trichogramma brassicae]